MNPNFASLVLGLAGQVEQALAGQLPPELANGVTARDVARTLIDTLGMLEDKTRGNLEQDEQKLLTEIVTQVRFRFVASESSGNN